MNIINSRTSPHHSSRLGVVPSMIVIHHTGGNTTEGTLSWFENPDSKVSSNYVIGRDGYVYEVVPESLAAWHTGACRWPTDAGPTRALNRESVGLELVNTGNGVQLYPIAQMEALAELIRDLQIRYAIPPDRIVGHRDIAWPRGRKDDPSKTFDWDELYMFLGAAHAQPAPAPRTLRRGDRGPDVTELQRRLIFLGYLKISRPSGVFAEQTEYAVRRVQQDGGITVDGIVGKQTREELS